MSPPVLTAVKAVIQRSARLELIGGQAMSKILSIDAVSRPQAAPRAVSQAGNLSSYAVSGLLLTAFLTGLMAICALLSLARLV
jgi:hypothetical protein